MKTLTKLYQKNQKCRRGNILLAVAMQGLHLKKCLKDRNENVDKGVLEESEIWLNENGNDCPRVNSLV